MLGVATVGLAATGRAATNGGSAGTPLITCSNGGSAGTPFIGYERWHCLDKGKPHAELTSAERGANSLKPLGAADDANADET